MTSYENPFSAFVLYCQDELRATDTDLAKMFQVSRSTIARWKIGRTRPHPLAESAVTVALLHAMKDRQDEIRRAIKESGWKPPYHVTGTDNPVDFPK